MAPAQNQQEKLVKRQNDPRKDVHQFMRIEGKRNRNNTTII